MKIRFWLSLVFPIFAVVFVISEYLILINQESYYGYYVNIPAIIFIIIVTSVLQIISGSFIDFWKLYRLMNCDKDTCNRIGIAIKKSIIYISCTSVTFFLLEVIDILKLQDERYIISNLGTACCSLFYGVIIIMCVLPMYFYSRDKILEANDIY